ncbi:alkaline phosphatase [Planctomicrobium piriforme]|uniref:Alkaline phosphatase n=1 Tax=Planctomicrobium piriforme TaxID=1576369 RepID=A0A1I3QED8_9PLAN|nr:alkaline phosphatase [Planctomicrobium piriforme]SFJ32278.1 alkaline phosphatase [Planctomicrobium piriforme]
MNLRSLSLLAFFAAASTALADHIRDLQTQAIESKQARWGHWGTAPDNYLEWSTHSNRLIPVYTYGTSKAGEGVSLKSYQGGKSPYATEAGLKKLYGQVPEGTLNPAAPYFDQTNIFDLQKAALAAGKKHIILVVFDGTDWITTYQASIYKNQKLAFDSGRGTGLHLQDYQAKGTSEFGWMVTSPWCDEAELDVNTQKIVKLDETLRGGYAYKVAGSEPWSVPQDIPYLIAKSKLPGLKQAYTDSASSATSMTAGIKTYNAAINVGVHGEQAPTIAHLAQQQGYRVGVVTSVPISHATPAAAYSHNVHRDDYQDLSRDLLGLPSISHPQSPLPGVDVLIGSGHGVERAKDEGQGSNFIPGNAYLTAEDLQKIDARHGGKYVVAQRTSGVIGSEDLKEKNREAISAHKRLLGFYGTQYGHLPFRTADGEYDPTIGRKKTAEAYSEADLKENPKLAEMATVALDFLNQDSKPFWLMVEPGDVDWANHDNNIDNSIGAVLSGDAAVKAITDWVEKNSSWEETVLIVTADHGHYLMLDHPELLVAPPAQSAAR